MFGFKKKRHPSRPVAGSVDQVPTPRKATARPAPVTYGQMRKLANAMLLIIKRWLGAMRVHNIRQHNELARDHARILKLLSEVKGGMSPAEQPVCTPEANAAPVAGEAAAPATEPREEKPGTDILKALGMSLNQYDEFLGKLKMLADSCSDSCFANRFAKETISGVECMRADVVSLLKMNDIELIVSAERFDPLRHLPIATCPRPDGETGDGEVRRTGLVCRRDGRDKIIKPASIVLYDDVKVQLDERR